MDSKISPLIKVQAKAKKIKETVKKIVKESNKIEKNIIKEKVDSKKIKKKLIVSSTPLKTNNRSKTNNNSLLENDILGTPICKQASYTSNDI